MPAATSRIEVLPDLKARAEGVRGGGLTLGVGRVRTDGAQAFEDGAFVARLRRDGVGLVFGEAASDAEVLRAAGAAGNSGAEQDTEAVALRALLFARSARFDAEDFAPLERLLRALRAAWGDSVGSEEDACGGGGASCGERDGEGGGHGGGDDDEIAPVRLGGTAAQAERLGARRVVLVPLRIRCVESGGTLCVRVRAGLAYAVPPESWRRAAAFGRAWLDGKRENDNDGDSR